MPPADETSPAASEPAAPSGGGSSDEAVAQDYFDEEIAAIHARIDELGQAVTHLTSAMQKGPAAHADAGSTAAEPSPTPRRPAEEASAGASLSSIEPEPERSPKPTHRWWRPLRGG